MGTSDERALINVIKDILGFSNETLINILKEISDFDNTISNDADKLFKYYYDEHWHIGIDRFSEITSCIEREIIRRIKNNKLNYV